MSDERRDNIASVRQVGEKTQPLKDWYVYPHGEPVAVPTSLTDVLLAIGTCTIEVEDGKAEIQVMIDHDEDTFIEWELGKVLEAQSDETVSALASLR